MAYWRIAKGNRAKRDRKFRKYGREAKIAKEISDRIEKRLASAIEKEPR